VYVLQVFMVNGGSILANSASAANSVYRVV